MGRWKVRQHGMRKAVEKAFDSLHILPRAVLSYGFLSIISLHSPVLLVPLSPLFHYLSLGVIVPEPVWGTKGGISDPISTTQLC